MATTRPVALVTGASSGIGKETARAFVAAGFELIGTGR
jgi:NADP-dependent 3-hydroxy acid dehydrogenase YdfG